MCLPTNYASALNLLSYMHIYSRTGVINDIYGILLQAGRQGRSQRGFVTKETRKITSYFTGFLGYEPPLATALISLRGWWIGYIRSMGQGHRIATCTVSSSIQYKFIQRFDTCLAPYVSAFRLAYYAAAIQHL